MKVRSLTKAGLLIAATLTALQMTACSSGSSSGNTAASPDTVVPAANDITPVDTTAADTTQTPPVVPDNASSVAGLWDFTNPSDVLYQLWDDEGLVVIYDYQADEEGSGDNCYFIQNLRYTRDGNIFTFNGFNQTVISNGNTLTIEGFTVPMLTGIAVEDLNSCL